MIKQLVLLNGPPLSGKDTLAKLLESKFGFSHFKITKMWKERIHKMYGLDITQYPYDYFEGIKDTPNDIFLGLTPRQAYIKVWEEYFKGQHGEHILLDWLITEIDNCENNFVVISDVGFDREARYLFNYFGMQAMLFRIYRRGHTFKDDSRKYVTRDSTALRNEIGKLNFRSLNLYNYKEPDDMITEFKYLWETAFPVPLVEKNNHV